ncbi:MAG: bifunctional 4-hydroxy-2-oxoglutarate aldolase/2-dehydro-3-deoxy-phosphogluconate aldolase [Ferruginibacter sp.]|nr:bifunctional 4-hydroxy-2-oxoglutarate aldolase/2-dehydro-3-deoxy-phosphogluconate aldolase [Cytophagales bacterium]
MARFTRLQVTLRMAETGMVPVFYHADTEVCKHVLQACYNGGVRVFEFTNRGDFAHERFAELNRHAATHFPELIMGAGTIMDAGTAALYIQLGANFIVAPLIKDDVAKACNRRKVAWVPGCATLTEISRAEELGAEVVKIFPGNVLGPAFVEALRGPMPWTSVMVTGGVEPEEENLKAWFKAGVTCVGMGSQLFSKSLLAEGRFPELEGKVKKTMEIIRGLKKG